MARGTLRHSRLALPTLTGGLTARRRLAGLAFAVVALPVLTLVGTSLRHHLSFSGDVPLYLLVVILTSIIGGFYPALLAAVAASLLLNYYFTTPLHTFTINEASNIVALVIFLLIAAAVSTVVDLAARRSHQAARARAEAETLSDLARNLLRGEQALTALLNAVSHDLRTPIAAAKAAISGLRAQEVSWSEDDRRELLATAELSMDRLTDLVTNLLDLSRLQAGVLPVLARPVGIDDIVARALEHVAADRELVVDVPPDLPEVLADAGLLERVIANVVQNALRFAPNGTPVRLAGSAHGTAVELRVIDRGPGIPREAMEAVFQAFQRRDDAPNNGDGVGLGLAIARGLTEAMGGTVRAEETPGGGATVVIELRAASPKPVEAVSWQ